MKCLSLNIRGFGGDVKVKNLRELLRNEEVQFLTVQETLISRDAGFISNPIWKHSSWNYCHSPSSGSSGGLLCIWDTNLFSVDRVFSSKGFLGVEGIWKGCSEKVSLCNIYGPQDSSGKLLLWDSLLKINQSSTSWWCLMGDFNVVRWAEERLGSTFHQNKASAFNSFIEAADLIDPPLGARWFT